MNTPSVPTYIINLKNRVDRKENVLNEFRNKPEFEVHLTEAIQHDVGAVGLWQTIKKIIATSLHKGEEYIIICEDDHQFTENYTKQKLFNCINEAIILGADVLCGGVSWFTNAVPASDNLFWVEKFSGLQFTVVFKKFFDKITDAAFSTGDAADYKLTELSESLYFMFPFISTQKDYGYSDVTANNNKEGRVTALFKKSIDNVNIIKNIKEFYSNQPAQTPMSFNYDEMAIPTYVINLPERPDRLNHIKKQFYGKNEFELKITEACKHEVGTLGLWLSIRKIIKLAIDNDEDVIIICEDDHEFTESYSKEYLLSNIIEAHMQGADYLSGGSSKCRLAVPVARNRYWISHGLATQFLVLYKKFFKKILDEPFDQTVLVDMLYSEISSNKMVLYPFISIQKNFGYSDVTPEHNANTNLVSTMFEESNKSMAKIHKATQHFEKEVFFNPKIVFDSNDHR